MGWSRDQLCSIRRSASSLSETSRKSSSSCRIRKASGPTWRTARSCSSRSRWRRSATRPRARLASSAAGSPVGGAAARAASKEWRQCSAAGPDRPSSAASAASASAARPVASSPAIAAFAVEPEQAHQRPEGQALDDQRRQHHGEGGEHDEVALREVGRQREGGRERHEAAHAAPADQHRLAFGRRRLGAAEGVVAVGEPDVGQHPGHAHQDEAEDHRQREPGRLVQPLGRHAADDGAGLQSHQQEGEDVEQEDRGVPDRKAVDARCGRGS